MSTTITCPSIVDIFSSGQTKHGNFKGVVNQLKWRQRFQRSDFYELELSTTEIITVKQILNGELKGLGTGMQVWPAAHVMVKYLEKNYRHSQGLVGKTVCDIGTGTGITGIAAANLGAKVTLTDQQHLLAFMQENVTVAEIAGIVPKGSLLVAQYDWGENAASLDLHFDFVLVSDCVLPKLYPIDILVEVRSALYDRDRVNTHVAYIIFKVYFHFSSIFFITKHRQ